MAPNRSNRRPSNNLRPCHLISLPLPILTILRPPTINLNYNSMMARYYSRRNLSRPSHPTRSERLTIRNNFIYHIRSFLLPGFLLSLLPLKSCPHPRTRGLLTTYGHLPTRPLWSPPSQHRCPFSLRGYSHLSPSQYYRRKSKRSHSSPHPYNHPRCLLHCAPSHRILWSPIYHCWWYLRNNFLCRHRLPRTTCNYRLLIPTSLPITTNPIPLHSSTPFWLRSRCMILTFCRRSLTIPLRFNLLMRLITITFLV